jgi:hypothetical protein
VKGRFFFFLAMTALAGLAASLAWAAAIMFGSAPHKPPLDSVLCAAIVPVAMLALWPRSDGERLLLGARLGLHSSNRRAALASCFAPFRPRLRPAAHVRGPRLRWTLLTTALIATLLASGVAAPFFAYTLFMLSLRRAAWYGDPNAILMEWDWLRVRGPVLTGAGRRLAARARAR